MIAPVPGSSSLLEAQTEPPLPASDTQGEPDTRFGLWLGATTVGALVFRVVYVLVVTRHDGYKLYDAAYYELQALALSWATSSP